MDRLPLVFIEPGPNGKTVRTVGGVAVWDDTAVPDPPAGTPAGYVPVVGGDGTVTWQPPTSESGGTIPHREVLMATGVTPPEPLESSDGYDWTYGEVPTDEG